jgi:phytoene dehydrogenase-like protein
MAQRYDVIVIGAGLGGLTAAALIARSGRKTLVVERNASVGGAASTYRLGDLVVEASLHETSDPLDPIDPKHAVLARIGVLDAVEWVPTGPIYEVRGGPVGQPFVLPDNFPAARTALAERFPPARPGVTAVLGDMERLAVGLGLLSRGRDAFRNPRGGFGALFKLAPMVRDWRRSVTQVFDRAFGSDEAVKCALAANLPYWHDDPDTMWWILFAVAQGGYLASGGRYVRYGSARLSNALADATRQAGGEIIMGRQVTEIRLDTGGRPSGVVHAGRSGEEPAEARAPIIVANAAPAVLAAMLPAAARERFWLDYAGRRLSISLFSATFGLSARPATLGFRSYSTLLLPRWMKSLSDHRRSADLLAAAPGQEQPLLTIVDYSAIDSGLGGPPYPVSVVGVDRLANWSGLDKETSDTKRGQWRQALIDAIDREFPGFASHVVASVFNTALSMRNYLNAPEGAIYGFAPSPPTTPIWCGTGRSAKTPIPGLYLASSYAGSGGFTGAILAGGTAADLIL